MDGSIREARWLLAFVFAMAALVATLGLAAA